MLILGVDTSTRTGSAAVLRDGEVLADISGYEETPYSTRLFRDVQLLQDRAGFRLQDVDLFAVAAGPGSFTGLRVGLTAVKAWAEVHSKPIAAVSVLEAIAWEGSAQRPGLVAGDGILAPFLDARRGQVFGAVYRRAPGGELAPLPDGQEGVLSPDEFLAFVQRLSPGPVCFVSPTPEAIPEAQLRRVFPDAEVVRVSPALASSIGRIGFARAQSGALVEALALDANYVRRSDAEASWKDA